MVIIEHCCAFGFLGTCQPLPCRRFKRTVGELADKQQQWLSDLFLAHISEPNGDGKISSLDYDLEIYGGNYLSLVVFFGQEFITLISALKSKI